MFPEDRRFAEAFDRGGLDEERKERENDKKEKDETHWKNHEAFQDMIKRARAEKKQADEEAALRLSEETAAAVSNAEAAVEPAADD